MTPKLFFAIRGFTRALDTIGRMNYRTEDAYKSKNKTRTIVVGKEKEKIVHNYCSKGQQRRRGSAVGMACTANGQIAGTSIVAVTENIVCGQIVCMITLADPGGTTTNRAYMEKIARIQVVNSNIIVPNGKCVETDTAGWSTSTEMET